MLQRLVLVTLILLLVALPVSAQDKAFLPLVGSNTTLTTDDWYPPLCSKADIAEMNAHLDTSGMIDTPEARRAGCLMPSTLVATSPDPAMGLSGASMPSPTDLDQMQAAGVQPNDWQVNRKLGIYRLDCGTNCGSQGVRGISGSYIFKIPTLTDSNWQQHFYGLWQAVANRVTNTVACPNTSPTFYARQHLLAGIGVGRFSSTYYTSGSGRVFWELYNYDGQNTHTCNTYVITDFIVDQNAGIYIDQQA